MLCRFAQAADRLVSKVNGAPKAFSAGANDLQGTLMEKTTAHMDGHAANASGLNPTPRRWRICRLVTTFLVIGTTAWWMPFRAAFGHLLKQWNSIFVFPFDAHTQRAAFFD